jgi:NAD(P)H-dependent FMN reductase
MQSEYLVLSTSLNPESNSRILARTAFEFLLTKASAEWIDARDLRLPFCDGALAFGDPNVAPLKEQISRASCIILGVPIYNYSTSGFAKNLIELTGSAWERKIVGFLCAAGGHRSYMSIMSLANSLMLDFECLVIPRFVHTSGDDFDGEKIKDPEVESRVQRLVTTAMRCTNAMAT